MLLISESMWKAIWLIPKPCTVEPKLLNKRNNYKIYTWIINICQSSIFCEIGAYFSSKLKMRLNYFIIFTEEYENILDFTEAVLYSICVFDKHNSIDKEPFGNFWINVFFEVG